MVKTHRDLALAYAADGRRKLASQTLRAAFKAAKRLGVWPSAQSLAVSKRSVDFSH